MILDGVFEMFDLIKNKFKKKEVVAPAPVEPVVDPQSPKALATQRGEPYINIMKVDIDPDNLSYGSFELDWNDIFVAKLLRAGYAGRDDASIVDQWFQAVCRNIVMETWEQEEAQERPARYTRHRDLGNGRTEVS